MIDLASAYLSKKKKITEDSPRHPPKRMAQALEDRSERSYYRFYGLIHILRDIEWNTAFRFKMSNLKDFLTSPIRPEKMMGTHVHQIVRFKALDYTNPFRFVKIGASTRVLKTLLFLGFNSKFSNKYEADDIKHDDSSTSC